jgi:predicted alpha/beta hydrolase family esterase
MKKQFIYINGWVPKENFKDYYDMLEKLEYDPYEEVFLSWNKTLGEKLGEDWEYLRAPLHDRDFADYKAWKIMFEKMLPYLNPEIYIWAGSLGGSFILKYLGENDGILHPKTGKKIRVKKLFLIAAAVSDTPQEVMGNFAFDLEGVYTRVARWCEKIYIYHSSDDTIVMYEDALKIKNYFPEAVFRDFHDRGHFYLETELPELVEDIKN